MLLKKTKKKIADIKSSKKINKRSNNGRQKKFSTKESESTALKKDVDKNKRAVRRGKEEEKPKEIENKNKIPLKMTRSVSGLRSDKLESGLNQSAVEKGVKNGVKNEECTEILNSESELINEKGKKKKQKLENENKSENEEDSESVIVTATRVNKITTVNLNKSNRSQHVEKGKAPSNANGLKKGNNRELTDGLDKQSNGCTPSKDGQDKKKGKKEIRSKTNKNMSSTTKGDTNLHSSKTKEKEAFVEKTPSNIEPTSAGSVKPQRVSLRIKKRTEQAENAKNAEKNKEGTSPIEAHKGYRLAVEGLRRRLVSSNSVDVDKIESARRRSGRRRKGSEEDVKQETRKETKSDVKQESVSTSTKKKGVKVEEPKIEKESLKKKKVGAPVPEDGKKGKIGTIQTKKDTHKKELEKTQSQEPFSKEKRKTGTEETAETKKELEKPDESLMKQNENIEGGCKGNGFAKGDGAVNSVIMGNNKDMSKAGLERKGSGDTNITKEKAVEDNVKKSGSKQERLSSGGSCNSVKQGAKGTEMTTESSDQTKRIVTENVSEEKRKDILLTEDVTKKKVKAEKTHPVGREKNKKETEGSNNNQIFGVRIEAPIVERRRGRKRKIIQVDDDILNKLRNTKENEHGRGNTFLTCEEEKTAVLDDMGTTIRSNGFIGSGAGICDGFRQKGSGRRSLLRTTFLCDKEGHISSERNKEDKTLFGLSRRKLKEESDELYTLQTDSVLNANRNKRKYVKKKYRKRYMDLLHEKTSISTNVRNNLFQSSLSRRVSNANLVLRNNRIGNKQDKKKSKGRLFPNETFMSKKEFLTNVNSINTVYNFNEEFLNFLCTVSNCDDIQYQPMLQFLGTIEMNLSKSISKEYSSDFLEKHNVSGTLQMMEHLVHILNNNNDILNKLNQLEYKFFNDLLEKMDDQHRGPFNGLQLETPTGMKEISNDLNSAGSIKLKLREFFQKGKDRDNGVISNCADHINKEFVENENSVAENKRIENTDMDTSVKTEQMTREEEGIETNAAKIAYSQTTCIEHNTLSSTNSPAHTSYDVEKEGKSKSKEDCMFHIAEAEKSDHWDSSEGAFNEKEQMENQNKFINKWTDKDCLKKIDTICKKFNSAVESMLKNEIGFSSQNEINKYINGEEKCLFENYISTTVYKDNIMMKPKSNMFPSTSLTNYNLFEHVGGKDDVFLEKYVQFFKKNNYINVICDELMKDKTEDKSLETNKMEMNNSPLFMNKENIVDYTSILEKKNEDILYSLNNDNSNNDNSNNDNNNNDDNNNDNSNNDNSNNDDNKNDNNKNNDNKNDDNKNDNNKNDDNKNDDNNNDNSNKDNIKKDNSNNTDNIEKEHENLIKNYKNCVEKDENNTKESLLPNDPLANTTSVLEGEVRVRDEWVHHEQKNEMCKEEYGLMNAETEIIKEEHSQQHCPEECHNKNADLSQELIKDQGDVLNHDSPIGELDNGCIQHTGISEIGNENEHVLKKYYSDTIALNSSTSLSSEFTHNKLFDSNTTDKGDNKLLWGEKNTFKKNQVEEILQKEDEKEERDEKYAGLMEATKHFNSESTICLENWDEKLERSLPEPTILDNKEVLLRRNSVDFAKNESITYTSTEHVESHTTASLQEELRVSKSSFIDSGERTSIAVGCNNVYEKCLLGGEGKEEEQNTKCMSSCTNDFVDSRKRFQFLKKSFIHTYNDNTISDLLEETFHLKDENSVLFNSAEKSSREILDCLYMISKIKKTVFDECTKMINNQIFFLEKNFQIPNCNLSILKNSIAFNNTK